MPGPKESGTAHTANGAASSSAAPKRPAAPPAPSRLGLLFSIKNWRIRTRITALLLLPVVVAALLGGLRIQSSVNQSRELDSVQRAADVISEATNLAGLIEGERDISAAPLTPTNATADSSQPVLDARKATDAEIDRYHAAVARFDTSSMPIMRATLDAVDEQLKQLDSYRKAAYHNNTTMASTINVYQDIINSLLQINQEAAEVTQDATLVQGARAMGVFGSAKSYASAQRAALAMLGAEPTTAVTDAYETMSTLNDSEQTALRQFKSIADPASVAVYDQTVSPDTANAVEQVFQQARAAVKPPSNSTLSLALSKGDASFDANQWWQLSSQKIDLLNQVEAKLGASLLTDVNNLKSSAKQTMLINIVLVTAALLFTIILGVVVARSLVRALNTLRRSALEIAEQRLPETVRRLAESDPGEVDLTVEPIGVLSRDEVGQVARAFDAVHSEAVRLAAEQALLRGNVNSMFVNLSRRSQSLIQRQLALISDLENREADPDQLANLFKLDHLATRMRRNGENLLVLAGEEPGRRWTRPVPLVDVLRAAASEVEQYERVELGALPTTDIAGRAVNDLVHLLAELLENSTTFSSPHTKVRVTGHILPDGRALIEIHDNGIGLTGDDLADANQRLARPPVVDVSISRRMGLFVVGRLATRHGIRVQLRPGEGGGTTALVMLPIELIQGDRPSENWQKPTGGQLPPGWEGDALTASQEMRAITAAPQGQQGPQGLQTGPLPAPERGDRDAERRGPRQLPQRAEDPAPMAAPSWGAPGYGDAPTTHDTPFPGTPFTPAEPERDNPFAPVGRDPRSGHGSGFDTGAGDRARAGDTSEFQMPFTAPEPEPYEAQAPTAYGTSEFTAPDYSTPTYSPAPEPDVASTGGFRIPSQEQYGDRFGERFEDTGSHRAVEPQRTTPDWGTQEFDRLAPVAPQTQIPSAFDGLPAQPRQDDPFAAPAPTNDALPALRRPAQPERLQQPPQPQVPQVPQPQAYGQPQIPQPVAPAPATPQHAPQPPRELFRSEPAAIENVAPQQPQYPSPLDSYAPTPYSQEFTALDASTPLPQEYNSAVEDERSPIFDTLESDWFHRRTNRGGRMRASQVRSSRPTGDMSQEPQPATPPLSRRMPQATNPPELPGTTTPATGAPYQQQPAQSFELSQLPQQQPEQSGWQSAGDDGWRAAEAATQPSSSGTTTAGLPRRVPRANLVPGGVNDPGRGTVIGPDSAPRQSGAASAPAPQTHGTQGVSRTPDEVRGRLTNFRRGTQQGRTAGTGETAPQSRDENNQEQA